ncbi:protein-L-isoaspartate(D-aspartate) O-methyltransferase [Candidatus Odyssella thessalonicensis]|uniref:protein-L-isoaspartate(D-aspartate) O-methyltransferase n=1 Tax=Candidatus Odyssella thessalonicensis TaxID=84647 RepID=UPI000225B173|nr:protein-L-isoaspartate(D-aspartate) O-methyltransferase [Candidatus Odyssella thessalonicensis]
MSFTDEAYDRLRIKMVDQQLQARDISDTRVLAAMKEIPRHLFVPSQHQDMAYEDSPVPIGQGQTISQPYIVAFMSQAAQLKPTDKVLEIGTGCGYQTAVLSQLCAEVYTIEIIEELAKRAQRLFKTLGYHNIQSRIGDGYSGWPEHAPYNAILVTAAPQRLPQQLVTQLKEQGRLIIPVKVDHQQELIGVTKTEAGIQKEPLIPVKFVPMTGQIEQM